MEIVTLYHGTKDNALQPSFEMGSPDRDYGAGFYTTLSLDLAKEWAWSSYASADSAYVYSYQLDTVGLDILDFTKIDSLHWAAEIFSNRRWNHSRLNEVVADNMKKFVAKYKLDTSSIDVIIGYPADNCCFSYAEDFVSYRIFRETIESMLQACNWGIEFCLKSKKALQQLYPTGKIEVGRRYFGRYLKRDERVRLKCKSMRSTNPGTANRTVLDFI